MSKAVPGSALGAERVSRGCQRCLRGERVGLVILRVFFNQNGSIILLQGGMNYSPVCVHDVLRHPLYLAWAPPAPDPLPACLPCRLSGPGSAFRDAFVQHLIQQQPRYLISRRASLD